MGLKEDVLLFAALGERTYQALQDKNKDIRITNASANAWLVADSFNPKEFVVYQKKYRQRYPRELIRTTSIMQAWLTLFDA